MELDVGARSKVRAWLRSTGTPLVAYGLLGLVVLALAVASWQGLVGFATDTLGLDGLVRYVVPISLDAAGAACAAMRLHAVLSGESAAGPRILTWLFVTGSAAANWYHASTHLGTFAAAAYFAGMSVAAVVMFDAAIALLRRKARRAAGRSDKPLARFRAARYLASPIETPRALLVAIRENIDDPDEAVARRREIKAAQDAKKDAEKAEKGAEASGESPVDAELVAPELEPAAPATPELTEAISASNDADEPAPAESSHSSRADEAAALDRLGVATKQDAVQLGMERLGLRGDEDGRVPRLQAWAASEGLRIDKSSVARAVRRHRAAQEAARAEVAEVEVAEVEATPAPALRAVVGE